MRKGIYYSLLPGTTPEEKFAAAAKYGFACVEIPTLTTDSDRKLYADAAKAEGIKIPSVMNQLHWQCPLSDPNADVRAKSVEGMFHSLETARVCGADTVLLVPAVVTPNVPYERAWEVSQNEIDKLLPAYEENKIYIAIENVGNRFLLSPTDFVDYIDEFDSRWVAGYFDVGNIVKTGFPEQWITTIGSRLKKIHVKGFDLKRMVFCSLLEEGCSIDWKAVMYALRAVGYDDVMTGELKGLGETPDECMTNISTDMDKIFALVK